MITSVKEMLGRVPMAADVYDALRGGKPRTRYNLEQLGAHLPAAVEETRPYVGLAEKGRKVLLFATMHYWIEQAAMLSLVLRGMGHDVTLGYLPFSSLDAAINAFDLRRQDLYTRRVLQPLDGVVNIVSLLDLKPETPLPEELQRTVETSAAYDTMYRDQVENFDPDSRLYRLRLVRNRSALVRGLQLVGSLRPDVVVVPNGLVTELGVLYQAARHLRVNTVTYEFNDQREQIWLAQNDIVMHQNMDALWSARGSQPLSVEQRRAIAELEDARSGARKYGKGTRFWQDTPPVGGAKLRQTLDLDDRPVVLLATNVLGDSLTLGRHVFAASMAQWIERTVQYFAQHAEVQLVVRVHPGERLMKGPSIMGVIDRALHGHADHIHVIGPAENTNTYDLMEIASLGLAYTTTVGMEMGIRGVPVIVSGNTHYRGRGFTVDPASWDEYFDMLNHHLDRSAARRLSAAQVETAWNYAYRFFFEYPLDFPWRLMHFWKDMETWPIKRVLSEEGQMRFGPTLDHLSGEPLSW